MSPQAPTQPNGLSVAARDGARASDPREMAEPFLSYPSSRRDDLVSPSWWDRWPLAVRIAALLAGCVMTAAAVLSYDALAALARAARVRPELSWGYPLLVDGVLAVGVVAALALHRAGWRTRAYIWAVIGAATAVSIAGNAMHASARDGVIELPQQWAHAASAVPACALATVLHVLVLLVRAATSPAPAPVAVRAPRKARTKMRAPEARVRLPDGREVSAGHARKLRARGRTTEAPG